MDAASIFFFPSALLFTYGSATTWDELLNWLHFDGHFKKVISKYLQIVILF